MEERNREDDRSESSDYTSEDEGTEDYRRGGYHAARIGDSFKSGRYIVQAKLGWGNFSTVWLAWDVQQSRYVALKVQKSAAHFTEAAMEEIGILQQIADGDPDDSKCVVKLLDHFKHSGPNGQHVCMVFEYLGDNLLKLIKYTDYRGLPLHMVKEICFHILVGLDYLHSKLSLIHTDLKPENVLLMSTIDPSKDPRKSGNPPILVSGKDKLGVEVKAINGDLTNIQAKKIRRKAKRAARGCAGKGVSLEANARLERFSARELSNDAKLNADSGKCDPRSSMNTNNGSYDGDESKGPRSENQGGRRGSLATRKKFLASLDQRCKLVDFGNTCCTYKQVTGDIQTRQYKCPEVILGSKYSTPADLWSFACICFELATGDVLFDPQGGDNVETDKSHLALMMELLGTMPRKIALGGRNSRDYFNKYGDLQHIRRLRFWPMNKVLKEKYEFTEQEANDMTDFLVTILDFSPQARPTAAQCILHPWMNTGPRLLEPSIARSTNDKQGVNRDAGKNTNAKRESEREAMEVGLGRLAIDSKTRPVKGVSTSGRLF